MSYFDSKRITHQFFKFLFMKTVIYFMSICLLGSCAPDMYVPNMQNIPAFTNKNQIKFNYSFLSPGGHDIQAAYSFTNKFSIMFNSAIYSNSGARGTYKAPSKGSAIEIGVGYFKPKNNLVFENYILFANGNLSNGEGEFGGSAIQPYGNFTSKLFRFSNQTSLAYKRKLFEVAVSNRICFLNYYNISKEPYLFNDIDMRKYINSSPHFAFIEPAFTVRLGLQNIKLQFQIQRSFSLKSIPSSNHYQYFKGTAFLGLQISI